MPTKKLKKPKTTSRGKTSDARPDPSVVQKIRMAKFQKKKEELTEAMKAGQRRKPK